VVSFEDLHEGMMITGKIKNVVDFGAFVDLGIKETALVHISEMSDHFIKDPLDAVKAGDVLEFRIISLDTDRRRIGLSRKSDAARQKPQPPDTRPANGAAEAGAGSTAQKSGAAKGKKPVTVKTAAQGASRRESGQSRPAHDDGTMYNPFAEAFRKAGKK
jgi:uncharacterized protein